MFHCCGYYRLGVCPNCGYCPNCGRADYPPVRPRPWPRPYPLPWYHQRPGVYCGVGDAVNLAREAVGARA